MKENSELFLTIPSWIHLAFGIEESQGRMRLSYVKDEYFPLLSPCCSCFLHCLPAMHASLSKKRSFGDSLARLQMWAFKATVQVVYCTGVTGLFDIPCGLWLVHNLHGGRQRPWPCINTPSCKFLLSSVLQTIEKSKCHTGVCPCSSLYQGHWCKGAKKRPEQQVGTSFIFWEAMDMNTEVSAMVWICLSCAHVLKAQSSGASLGGTEDLWKEKASGDV